MQFNLPIQIAIKCTGLDVRACCVKEIGREAANPKVRRKARGGGGGKKSGEKQQSRSWARGGRGGSDETEMRSRKRA